MEEWIDVLLEMEPIMEPLATYALFYVLAAFTTIGLAGTVVSMLVFREAFGLIRKHYSRN